MKIDSTKDILKNALVPEHSLPLMEAVSGGDHFLVGPWLFYKGQDWLMAIGYPLFKSDQTFAEAIKEALAISGAKSYFAIAPKMPDNLEYEILEKDDYYVLSANAKIPPRLKNVSNKAAENLVVERTREFTAAHRKLWTEFLASKSDAMNPRVRELYARTPRAMRDGRLEFLDAKDKNGNLAATLLLDFNPANFVSYILGAHSRQFYAPHAMDLLFFHLLRLARENGKKFIHLGLGVNPGITRFKKKWGGVLSFPYCYAEGSARAETGLGKTMARALLYSGQASRRLPAASTKKPFAMIWEAKKNNAVSYLAGTAHFFCHSFEYSFRKLFRDLDNVIFEGPLDADFMARVSEAGRVLPPNFTPVYDYLDEKDIRRLEWTVNGSQNKILKMLNMTPKVTDVRRILRTSLPWSAFFSLWTAYLERLGWRDSVDMEAWRIANEMGKNVIGMESLEEQLESLGSLPMERVVRFFRNCGQWRKLAASNRSAYLAGDLERMMGSSAEFPTRTEHVIGHRDERFRQRMRPWLEKGGTVVFVGSAHLVNLRQMLVEDGFKVTWKPFGILPRLRSGLKKTGGKEVTW